MFALADCNNFFVSCERVFRPDLNGKPVIVLSNNDGCAIARSNEAKALGIKMGDPLFKIRDLVRAHGVALFSGNMSLYDDMSQRVRWVLEEFAPSIEVYSIDEAFLDLRGLGIEDYDNYAKRISERCWRYTSIPVSVGIAPTKTLAKIASELCKQYPKLNGGCYMHRPQDIERVLKRFSVGDVWGIGRKSARKLSERGVVTAYDFTQLSESVIRGLLGVTGLRTWQELQGVPCIDFEDTIEAKQSICVSRSFSSEISAIDELCQQVANFAALATRKLRAQHSACAEMSIFAYTNRFRDDAPQAYGNMLVTYPEATCDHRTIIASAVGAVRELHKRGFGYKKAGVVLTKLIPQSEVARSLFTDADALQRERKLSSAMDTINHSFGHGAIKFGAQGNGEIKMARENQSPHYTTRWDDLPKVKL